LNSISQTKDKLNDFLQEVFTTYASKNDGFQPELVLVFLGFNKEFIERYLEMHTVVRETIKSMQKVDVPWRLEDTGFLRVDCFNALAKLLQREFHFAPEVIVVDSRMVIRVNGFEVCTKTVEQVREFAQTVKTESYSFY
jgi:hypothetical protein